MDHHFRLLELSLSAINLACPAPFQPAYFATSVTAQEHYPNQLPPAPAGFLNVQPVYGAISLSASTGSTSTYLHDFSNKLPDG